MNKDLQDFSAEEKIKPFRLLKFFVFTSLALIFIGTIVLSFLNTHWAKNMLRKKSEDYALLLIENLNHQVFVQFVIPVALKYGKIQLRNKMQFERMDKVVRSTLHSFNVDLVNIYNLNNTISYSFDQKLIGKVEAGGADYKRAVEGKTSIKLVQEGNWWEVLTGLEKNRKVITFAPLRVEKSLSSISGPVLGVVEIVQDLSKDYEAIISFQIRFITTSSVIMGMLFIALVYVVKRGEDIIQKRAQERLELREQLSKAERLSSLGEMAAKISHEIRNPLGIIMSSAEHLKKKMAVFDPSSTIPNIIVEESTRLNNIITDFFNFATPRGPDLIPCRVDEVIEKNIKLLALQTREQGHIIRKNYSDEIPVIMADSIMLYQAFLNIMINSIQAMPDGGEIYIEINSNNSFITIIFEDQGEGIPENLLKKIWDPFFTTKEEGTGLGLGIVKNLIESHGGDIRIENRPKRGVKVLLRLPIKQGA